MRILCSFVGGAGHLVPQLPLLRALAGAGHDLTLFGRASAAAAAPVELFRSVVARPDGRTSTSSEITPLVPVDREAEVDVVARYFAGEAARRSAAALQPRLAGTDAIVCDELDFGAMAAGASAGVPVVVVSVIASGALVREDRVGDALKRLAAELGVAWPFGFQGDLFVVPFAPRMRAPEFPAPPGAVWMRPDAGAEPDPDGTVVVTLGTEFNTESGDLFHRILAGLADTRAQVVVAVGSDLDPERFGRQPQHIRIERFVDLDPLIARSEVILHHGGSGLFVRSVLGGAPQLVFPMGADQPFTADRVADLGIGLVLDPLTATPQQIAAGVAAARADGSMRKRIMALREETFELPDAADVASRVIRAVSAPRSDQATPAP